MAFLIEDGSGVAGANSFVTVATYKAYCADRGMDVSCQADDEIETFLIRATDYIERTFGRLYLGTRSTTTQTLGHPRTGIVIDGVEVPSDELASVLVYATCEYAFRASKYRQLTPDQQTPFDREMTSGEIVSGSGAIVAKKEKVGPIEESSTYADPTTVRLNPSKPSYPEADLLMTGLLVNGGRGRVIRN